MNKLKTVLILALSWCGNVYATNLVDVYHQALHNDPVFQQAVANQLITKTGVPLSIAAILPNLSFTGSPSISRISNSGSLYNYTDGFNLNPRNMTVRNYAMQLTLTQTLFDFSKFSQVSSAMQLAHGANATLNAALQNLMLRVANNYFAVLRDEDSQKYNEAAKLAYAEQLNQIKQQFNVGLKTVTDVYIAQAAYDSAVANYIGATVQLATDKENLRAQTGVYSDNFYSLKESFPLITPAPHDINAWVTKALQQNWSIKAAYYQVNAAKFNIKQQTAGHLPSINFQASINRNYTDTINGYNSLTNESGPGTQNNRTVGLNVSMPILAVGGVIAATQLATHQYELAQATLEQVQRNTENLTRQSYLNVIAGISQVKADQQAIKSNQSSLHGMEESFRVGTETLVNVLNQQQKLFEAQTKYAKDRYALVINILQLKLAAGVLSEDDLHAVNEWLYPPKHKTKIIIKANKFKAKNMA